MKYITEKDVTKLNMRIGKIKAVKRHDKIDEYILLIDLGTVEQDMQIVADLKPYSIPDLIGKQVVFIENVKPTMVRGIESQGMLLIAHRNGKPVLLGPDKQVSTGVKVYGVQDGEVCHYEK